MRELATRYMLPSLKKIVKNGDYRDLSAKVMEAQAMVESHINEILLIEKDSNSKYKFKRSSLRDYADVARKVLKVWVDESFFKCLREEEISKEAGVFASLFYLALYNVLSKHLPDMKQEYYQTILGHLQPELSPDGKTSPTLDIISAFTEPEQREPLAESIELAVSRIVQLKMFSNLKTN